MCFLAKYRKLGLRKTRGRGLLRTFLCNELLTDGSAAGVGLVFFIAYIETNDCRRAAETEGTFAILGRRKMFYFSLWDVL